MTLLKHVSLLTSSVETTAPSLSCSGWNIFSISCLNRWTNYIPGQSRSTIYVSLPATTATSHFPWRKRHNFSLALPRQTQLFTYLDRTKTFPTFLLETAKPSHFLPSHLPWQTRHIFSLSLQNAWSVFSLSLPNRWTVSLSLPQNL